MIYECEILTPWAIENRTNIPFACAFHDVRSWEDVTGQDGSQIPPKPNLVVIKAVVTQSLLSVLAADKRLAILWSEPAGQRDVRQSNPTREEMATLAEFLKTNAGIDGLDVIGTDTHLISRTSVAFRVKNWTRRLKQ